MFGFARGLVLLIVWLCFAFGLVSLHALNFGWLRCLFAGLFWLRLGFVRDMSVLMAAVCSRFRLFALFACIACLVLFVWSVVSLLLLSVFFVLATCVDSCVALLVVGS